ncbi:MAG: mercury(II) reductase [Acidobacteriota bacterium]|nr:mercury(II) reductase [Acidobacteriota bacterium]
MTPETNDTLALRIDGMTCEHCAITIQRALAQVGGVQRAAVSYPEARADVELAPGGPATTAVLVAAVERAGYRATPVAGTPVAPARGAQPAGPAVRSGGPRPDVVVLGGGSAGFAASIHAADLGARVTLIEGGTLGGTCVNVGCVPSKTLIRAVEVQHRAAHHPFAGIHTAAQPPDLPAMIAQKDALVATLRQEKYWDVLAAYPNITLRQDRGRVNRDGSLAVGDDVLKPGRLIVTTGSSPWAPPITGLAEAGYLTSTEALALTTRPASLVVVGSGSVGIEIAQIFARLGTQVTVFEALPTLVPAEAPDAGAALAGYLQEEGLTIRTGASVDRVSRDRTGYLVEATVDGQRETMRAEQLLVATGRRANTRGFGLDEAGVRLGRKGEIAVNEYLETSRPGVYAAGDVIGDPMFVYVAAYGGNLAAENALDGPMRRYDLSALPRVTFTDPQVASVGLSEQEARAQGLDVAVSTLPLAYVPRALAARDTRGFITLVADRQTNRLVGALIVSAEAGEMIQEPTLAIRHGISVTDLAATFHPYLTLAEGIKLAAQTFTKDVKKLSCCAA